MALLALCATASCQREETNPAQLFVISSTGSTFLRRGQLPEAEAQFKNLIKLAPDDPAGHANLGLTYLRGGRFDEAERELKRARRLDPNNVDVVLSLARLYSLTNRRDEARTLLESSRPAGASTGQGANPRVLYALAELEAGDTAAAPSAEYQQRLRDVLAAVPTNLAARLKLARAFVHGSQADSAARLLEEFRVLRPEPPVESRAPLREAIELLRAGKSAEAREPFTRFAQLLELTQPYQAAWEEIEWTPGPISGRPVLTFEPQSKLKTLGVIRTGASADSLIFQDVTADAPFGGRAAPAAAARRAGDPPALTFGDFDNDDADDLFASFSPGGTGARVTRMFRTLAGGEFADATVQWSFPLNEPASAAAVGDVDNDGWLDLFVVTSSGRGRLLRNAQNGRFVDVSAKSAIGNVGKVRRSVFVDADHDGDLDLLIVGAPKSQLFRNNADGSFTEVAESMGLGGLGSATDVEFADLDDDGRLDLVFATPSGAKVLRNTGLRRFEDVTAKSGLSTTDGGVTAIDIGDYDNDGTLDLVLLSTAGAATLWRNSGTGTFARDRRSDGVLPPGSATQVGDGDARFIDVDNDGWLDFIAVGPQSATLLRNDRSGRFARPRRGLPNTVTSGRTIVADDVDGDGDEDLFIGAADGGVRVLRNQSGSANLAARITLTGLRSGSGKNNTFGIGSTLQLRAGEIFQTRVATGRVTLFGLGPHLKADVLRVQWPNGVPETIYFPGTDQDVLELEQLKGSCAFLYTWDGKTFRFITDVMWRSALGMPMGLMAGGKGVGAVTAYAPAGASQEYLRIPGNALQAKDGHYALQLTEELWETAYMDQVRLIAVDHPDSVDVFVDERFVPPGSVALRPYLVSRPQAPRSAVDDRGRDVLAALLANDKVYVSNLTPLAYQGVVETHDLVMDLGPDAGEPGSALFLRGWIYPTDASINVALSQQSAIKVSLPTLEVRDARGAWVTATTIGFPSGKDKTIVVDLGGRFPTSDHHVRIRTNMQIYWDQAFTARDMSQGPRDRVRLASPAASADASLIRVTTIGPVSADLHFRGYSRMYRAGGRFGPQWFDYDSVTRESPWRPIEGAFTRFGDVLPLLRGSDDQYVVMAPGDEMTVKFSAASADSLPPGWKRDFLLYTDGWIKDSDLNTAHGTTVEPLPFHAIKSYPYAPGDAYPTDSAHQRYLREYNTREIRRR
ncbi:MAG TPA: FG-GAP-like repeat-containing protein [Gemmatimonadaceae bacterium]|nr:FG-GAP-like repeat-containing protein [Gemmatimonadaceae bacterium]